MSQPTSGAQFVNIGTIGTVVVSSESATLQRVAIPGTFVGTVIIHNSPTAAGTSTTSPVYTLGIPGLNLYRSVELGIQCRNGITYESTGTPNLTLVWDK